MKKVIRTLSILLGIFSLVSFVQRLFDIGLVAMAGQIIDYYRIIAYFFIGLPGRMIGFHFPSSLMDMWTLSFIGAAAYAKTPNIENARFFRRHPSLTKVRYWKFWLLGIFGLSGIGLAALVGAISPFTYVDGFHEDPLDLSKRAGINVLYIIGGAIAFFIINAFGPTV
jgi:hypothetical protein